MGGALLSGGLRSFGLLHCGIRSRRHCGARMAAPGTAIVENERDGQHWGRHLPHGVTVAQLLGSNLESVSSSQNEINSRSCDEKRIYIKF